MGISIEFHDFFTRSDATWAYGTVPGCVEICFNIEGSARVAAGDEARILQPASVIVSFTSTKPPDAMRCGGGRQRFISLKMTAGYLRSRFHSKPPGLLPVVDRVFEGAAIKTEIAAVRPFTPAQSAACRSIVEPPVHSHAVPLWYEARISEWLAECLFTKEHELFCHRQQRTDRERIGRAKAILAVEFAEPPTLSQLAARVGMSSFYLSRTFSKVAGETIARHIRRLKIERAAELLRKGKHNVTEAAFEVGYSSLGHFSRNFSELLGCTPSEFTFRNTEGGSLAGAAAAEAEHRKAT